MRVRGDMLLIGCRSAHRPELVSPAGCSISFKANRYIRPAEEVQLKRHLNKRFRVIDYHESMTPMASYDGRDEAVQCAQNTNASSGHPTAVIDSHEKKGQRAVDVFNRESFYQSRRSDIEIIGGFTDSKLKGREILGWRIDKGWVHVCYLRDLKHYLAKRHYNTPGSIEILTGQRKPDSHGRRRQNSPGGSKRALKPSKKLTARPTPGSGSKRTSAVVHNSNLRNQTGC